MHSDNTVSYPAFIYPTQTAHSKFIISGSEADNSPSKALYIRKRS